MGLSIQDIAIVEAYNNDTLEVVEATGRFGKYVYISDTSGVIECFENKAEAEAAIERAVSGVSN